VSPVHCPRCQAERGVAVSATCPHKAREDLRRWALAGKAGRGAESEHAAKRVLEWVTEGGNPGPDWTALDRVRLRLLLTAATAASRAFVARV